MKFLCVGYGSIGKRHSSILRGMGHEVVTVDPYHSAKANYRYLEAVQSKAKDFAGVLDCTPIDVRAGWKFQARCRFIEKPLGELPVRMEYPIVLGFCYYWLPSLRKFVEALTDVRIYAVQIVGGQWLPDWHEGDYRDRYHGTPGRGGVVLDSLPHSLFIARWILGDVEIVGAVTGKLSGLDIKTEDMASVLLRARTGQPCYLQASYLRQPRGFWVEAETSGGTMRWDFDPAEADEMYSRQMEVFCEVAEGKRQYGYPDLAEGMAVQRLLQVFVR